MGQGWSGGSCCHRGLKRQLSNTSGSVFHLSAEDSVGDGGQLAVSEGFIYNQLGEFG